MPIHRQSSEFGSVSLNSSSLGAPRCWSTPSRRHGSAQQLDEGGRPLVSEPGGAPPVEKGRDRLRHLSIEPRRVGVTNDDAQAARTDLERGVARCVILCLDAGGTSASHLKTLFKRSMGISVHAYVVQRRVTRARQLLLKGDLPSSQVALESGFADQSHMARCFRRLLGLTPSELRKS